MKQTFLDDITELLAFRPTSQRNEVLFLATAQSILSYIFAHTQNQSEKDESVFYFHKIRHEYFLI